MIDYKKIKAIAWDFDDTLFAHANHKTETEKEKIDYIKNCLLYANNENIDYSEIFSECRANVFLERFMNRAYNNNIVQGLISGTNSYVCAEAKIDCVDRVYGHVLENWCCCSQEQKIIMLKAIAKANGYSPLNILIIDDNAQVITMAADAGFQSATPIEVVNFVI